MSTIKVNKIENTATADGGIAIDASGHVTVDGQQLPTAGALSNRNLVANGSMIVAQRGTSTTGVGATNNVFPCVDRFKIFSANTAGRMTVSQDSDAPAGFAKSMKLATTTADTSIAAGELFGFRYTFEGQDLQMLDKGASGAKQITLSFYVKANAAATYTVELHDVTNTRHNTQNFSVTTSWTRVVLTFAGDTTGTLTSDNADRFRVNWWLHGGSTYTGGTFTSNTWAARSNGNMINASDTSIFDSTSRTLFITGVQLEVGDKATPFEHRSFGDELARCQRYYNMVAKGNGATMLNFAVYATNNAYGVLNFPVHMRATPTVDSSDGTGHFQFSSAAAQDNFDTLVAGNGSERAIEFRANSSGGLGIGTAGNAGWVRLTNASAFIGVSAEL